MDLSRFIKQACISLILSFYFSHTSLYILLSSLLIGYFTRDFVISREFYHAAGFDLRDVFPFFWLINILVVWRVFYTCLKIVPGNATFQIYIFQYYLPAIPSRYQ